MAVSAEIQRKIALVVLPPLLLAVAGLTHPHSLTPDAARTWATAHIWLLPVWPLLAVGLIVPLWRRPTRDLAGVATVIAWVAAYGYATFYTGLDAVAGIAAGTARLNEVSRDGSVVGDLFTTGDALGYAGAYCLLAGVVAGSFALFLRHGWRVAPGFVVLVLCCWSFVDSHIFWPRGVVTMLGFAVGFALLTAAGHGPGRHPDGIRAGSPATT